MFEKSLQDMVKGIRRTNNDPAFVAKCLQEIKEEARSRDVTVKAQALAKMTYLYMSGHDMTWASFTIIEIMTQERFSLKRIGYLAACQSFTPKTDVLVLCTALLKKEFGARTPWEAGLALNCLANIATEELARDLLPDVTTMLTSSRAYIRKKATTLMYKCFVA
jgi:AP-3 complex subunit delta-1